MTHEELLAKIDNNSLWNDWDAIKNNKALRAVVELHKPIDAASGLKGCGRCIHTVFDNGAYMLSQYPCPTIQAIEKELS